MGIDVGNKQQSRKQFNDLLTLVCSTINRKIDRKLCAPLPATGYPPHFFITFDKSTPSRETNQAIIIAPVVDGERVPYFLGAPEVYSVEEAQHVLSGGQWKSGGLNFKGTEKCPPQHPKVIMRWCCGRWTIYNQSVPGCIFFGIEHFKFVQLLAVGSLPLPGPGWEETNGWTLPEKIGWKDQSFPHTARSWKMHQIAQNIGANLGERTLVTKSLSTTRFISSTLESYTAISRCFKQYVTAMYEYGGMRRGTKEKCSEDEYMVVVLDFVIDLLIIIDVLSTLVLLMIRAQELQQPGLKIIPNTEKLFE